MDVFPKYHRESGRLSDLVTVVVRHSDAAVNATVEARGGRRRRPRFDWSFEIAGKYEREKDDYAYCLRRAVSVSGRRARYVMLVEDDVIVDRTALEVLSAVFRQAPRGGQNGEDGSLDSDADAGNCWLFVKLYYPDKWLGYGAEMKSVVELISIGALGGAFGAIVRRLMCGATTRRSRVGWGCFCASGLYAVLLCYGLGRQHARAWRREFPAVARLLPGSDCCTQAVVYPSAVVPGLLAHLSEQSCNIDFPIDLAIGKYGFEKNLKFYAVDPNIVRHVGLISTLRQYSKQVADFLEF